MPRRIVECVPNFSEGRDRLKIKQITDAVEAVPGVSLLDVDPGAATHRTVVTFTGEPDAVAEAAFRAVARAAQVVDMRTHHGEHPRIGASDVVPFVPVEGATMQDCVELARRTGERIGRELGIPVYLYEEAATSPARRNLADIRRGEYEGLARKLADPGWKPDFGPAEFNARSGATVVGAREFLIAYNVTLNSRDKAHATEIAFELREKGRVARTGNIRPRYDRGTMLFYREGALPCGECDFTAPAYDALRDHARSTHGTDLDALLRANDLEPPDVLGQKAYRPGRFKACKAVGWFVGEYGRAQISVNLTNWRVTPPHSVLDEARRLAAERGLMVTGSEIVGLVPFQALREAGRHYLRLQGKSTGVPAADVLQTAVFSMGLNDVQPFDTKKKVLGLPSIPDKALVRMNVADFTDEVSRHTPAPGGGSIAALCGALGAALSSMVANLAHGRQGSEPRDAELLSIAERAQEVKDRLVEAIDADTDAFNAYMEARRLPQDTPERKAAREAKMQEGLRQAVSVPLSTAELSFEALQLAGRAARAGNPASITDAAVGAQVAFAGVRGGIWNVLVNLKDITDPAYNADMRNRCADLLARARAALDDAAGYSDAKLAEMLSA